MEEKIFGDIASLSGYEWNLFRPDERFVSAVVQAKGVPDIVARVVAARSIALEDVDAYLEPKLKSLLPDPSVLKEMDRAAARLARALEDGHPIGSFGDYDVDGATSSA
ncbi:MAG: single-stranded-DNA-specific exonuclease RecJ, partial [Rickettsiales bacterium]|nr:single-stranded-DNA-specific exonuclease RecJ [Rickettsiales bacterium]